MSTSKKMRITVVGVCLFTLFFVAVSTESDSSSDESNETNSCLLMEYKYGTHVSYTCEDGSSWDFYNIKDHHKENGFTCNQTLSVSDPYGKVTNTTKDNINCRRGIRRIKIWVNSKPQRGIPSISS